MGGEGDSWEAPQGLILLTSGGVIFPLNSLFGAPTVLPCLIPTAALGCQ